MDEEYKQAVIKKVKPKFGRKKSIPSAVVQRKPKSAEREYQRLAKEVDMAVIEVVRECLPQIKAICDRRYDETHRDDSQSDDLLALSKVFQKALAKLDRKGYNTTLYRRITQLANLNRKLTISEWKRTVKSTLGVDVFEDYYNGANYQRLVDDWIEDNVELVKSVPSDALSELEKIVMDGWYNSRSTKSIMKDIQETFKTSKSKAKLLANDQTAKLCAKLTQYQQQDAGCEEYIWSASDDARVRDRHRDLHGKKFRWDDPPVVDEKTGRRCHPGEDYNCRCIAIPVFSIEELNIPVQPQDWDEIDARTKKILEQSMKK